MGKVTGNPSSRYLVTENNGNQYYTNSIGNRWDETWEAHDVQGQAAYNLAVRAGLIDPLEYIHPSIRPKTIEDEYIFDGNLHETPQDNTVTVDTPEVAVEPLKKNPVAPKRNAAPANNGLGKYGFAGDVQRNWRGTRGAIDPNVLAKLKETGFTGTTAKEAQQYMNSQFGNVGMFGYKVATDNAWGSQSQKAFDQFYKSWKEHQLIKPDELKSDELKPVELPVDAPDFGYRTSNTYEGNDFANRMKSMGIQSNADLIDFMHKNNNGDFNGDAWAKQFHSDVNRALGGDYSDANIRKTFHTKNGWGGGFLGKGDFTDFQNALQTNAGAWNGAYDRKQSEARMDMARQQYAAKLAKLYDAPLITKPTVEDPSKKYGIKTGTGASTLGTAGAGSMGSSDDWMQFAAQFGYLPQQ